MPSPAWSFKGTKTRHPLGQLHGKPLLSAVAVMNGWEVVASDASTAYLQSQGISRLLILRATQATSTRTWSQRLVGGKRVHLRDPRRRAAMVEGAVPHIAKARVEDVGDCPL